MLVQHKIRLCNVIDVTKKIVSGLRSPPICIDPRVTSSYPHTPAPVPGYRLQYKGYQRTAEFLQAVTNDYGYYCTLDLCVHHSHAVET